MVLWMIRIWIKNILLEPIHADILLWSAIFHTLTLLCNKSYLIVSYLVVSYLILSYKSYLILFYLILFGVINSSFGAFNDGGWGRVQNVIGPNSCNVD